MGTFHLVPGEWGDGHCWVDVGGVIIDVTATQFDSALPAVCVLRPSDVSRAHYAPADETPCFDGWPAYQMPSKKLRRMVLANVRVGQ